MAARYNADLTPVCEATECKNLANVRKSRKSRLENKKRKIFSREKIEKIHSTLTFRELPINCENFVPCCSFCLAERRENVFILTAMRGNFVVTRVCKKLHAHTCSTITLKAAELSGDFPRFPHVS